MLSKLKRHSLHAGWQNDVSATYLDVSKGRNIAGTAKGISWNYQRMARGILNWITRHCLHPEFSNRHTCISHKMAHKLKCCLAYGRTANPIDHAFENWWVTRSIRLKTNKESFHIWKGYPLFTLKFEFFSQLKKKLLLKHKGCWIGIRRFFKPVKKLPWKWWARGMGKVQLLLYTVQFLFVLSFNAAHIFQLKKS